MPTQSQSSPPISTERFYFSRDSRLLKHSSFEMVYKKGRRHFSHSMTFFYILRPAAQKEAEPGSQKPASSRAQIGFTVGRVLGGSVERNRIRRRVREAVRHHLPPLKRALAERSLSAEIVINPKKSALKTDAAGLQSEVARAFQAIAGAKSEDVARLSTQPGAGSLPGK